MRRALLWSLLSACSAPLPASEVPITPVVKTERATVKGRVLDGVGAPVASALVWAAESDDSTTTALDGTFTLSVPSDTTLTLRALKEVFTGTSLQPFTVTAGSTVEGLEVTMIPGSTLGLLNNYASGVEEHGAVAVTAISLSATCNIAGGTVRLELVPTAKALYVPNGLRAPDTRLQVMQSTGKPNAWIAGVPAGTGYELIFEKSGCRQVALPVSHDGLTWQPGLRVTRGLTVANVFVE